MIFLGGRCCPSAPYGGSGFGSMGEKLVALKGENVTWLAGARFSADTEAEELTDGFREMGIEP